MLNEIRLDTQASDALKKKLNRARSFFEAEELELANAERLAGGLCYAQIINTIRQSKKGTADTIKKIEAFQTEYEIYEKAIEEWDSQSAGLLNNMPNGHAQSGIIIESKKLHNDMKLDSFTNSQDIKLHVRALLESNTELIDGDEAINWQAGAKLGSSTITVTFKNGQVITLYEKEDYYIDEDWKAYLLAKDDSFVEKPIVLAKLEDIKNNSQ
ncbi:MAG: hypothetical protein FWG61_04135 [Firmicutes bacterium]|nr:hypothetical protein [Bacillota bacterium]